MKIFTFNEFSLEQHQFGFVRNWSEMMIPFDSIRTNCCNFFFVFRWNRENTFAIVWATNMVSRIINAIDFLTLRLLLLHSQTTKWIIRFSLHSHFFAFDFELHNIKSTPLNEKRAKKLKTKEKKTEKKIVKWRIENYTMRKKKKKIKREDFIRFSITF